MATMADQTPKEKITPVNEVTEIRSINDSDSGASERPAIVLIPRPSSDPRDPLNWSFGRKVLVTSAICLASFTAFAGPFNGQIQIVQQSKLYQKTTVEITYFNSAASAGFIVGVWFYWPLAKLIGRSATVFYTLIFALAAQIWGCFMRNPDQYWGYFAAKFFMGFFGSTSALASLYIVDVWFLHQRGRAFNILGVAMNLGASFGPSLSGFITLDLPWYYEYYWSIALTGFTIVYVFCFLEETGWDRTGKYNNDITKGDSWLQQRVKTFFPGHKIVAKKASGADLFEAVWLPLRIGFTPTILLITGFVAISFGFWVALNALTPVWLQTPIDHGGYGFTVLQNAGFTLIHWAAVAVNQVYGQYLADALPLYLSKRSGKWKPEYRLHTLWVPGLIFSPLGLGMVGFGIQYHLSWGVLLVGNFLVTVAALQAVPITINYVAESFRARTVEATIPLHAGRLLIGLTINFYVKPWIAVVGTGWVYGSMAFFTIFAFGFLVILMFWGDKLRARSNIGQGSAEDGAKITGGNKGGVEAGGMPAGMH